MDYQQAISYLNSFVNYEKLPVYVYKESVKLQRITNFLRFLENPHESLRVIHVAGTKGKGSTSSFLAYILKEAGFKVGLYTSPHLSEFRERIRILDQRNLSSNDFEGMISKEDVCRLVEELTPKIDNFNKISEYGHLTYFEIFTSLAFEYFKQEQVDFVVLETGMGGRLDATNVVNPLVSVITPISLEHTKFLGTSLTEIASEKSGIIKSDVTVISASQQKVVEDVLQKKTEESKARILFLGKDFFADNVNSGLNKQAFDIKLSDAVYRDLTISLNGAFQIVNAAVSVAAIHMLKEHNINISETSIRRGLASAKWPGRFEIISSYPVTILDGAQNAHSVGALMDSAKRFFKGRKIVLILGISKDKDIKGMGEILRSSVDLAILTKANNPRAALPAMIQNESNFNEYQITDSVEEAIELAKTLTHKEDVILITGSLFVVGEARDYFNKDKIYAIAE